MNLGLTLEEVKVQSSFLSNMRLFALWVVGAGVAGVGALVSVDINQDGSYRVLSNGQTVLESAESPCGIQAGGRWCHCGANITTPTTGCQLQIAARNSGDGTDALGRYYRTEITWADQMKTVTFVIAFRVYEETSTKVR